MFNGDGRTLLAYFTEESDYQERIPYDSECQYYFAAGHSDRYTDNGSRPYNRGELFATWTEGGLPVCFAVSAATADSPAFANGYGELVFTKTSDSAEQLQ
ncbi:hypothetical protein FACS1894219_04170 [Clostridia bacterium]|nr:hypothetical protein FACS1894219_04170 [Clostridia bacterium]